MVNIRGDVRAHICVCILRWLTGADVQVVWEKKEEMGRKMSALCA